MNEKFAALDLDPSYRLYLSHGTNSYVHQQHADLHLLHSWTMKQACQVMH